MGPGDTDLWKKSDVENLVSDSLKAMLLVRKLNSTPYNSWGPSIPKNCSWETFFEIRVERIIKRFS